MGRAFLLFPFLFRSLSFFLFASALHLETLPFQFDSLNCTTSLPVQVFLNFVVQGFLIFAILAVLSGEDEATEKHES